MYPAAALSTTSMIIMAAGPAGEHMHMEIPIVQDMLGPVKADWGNRLTTVAQFTVIGGLGLIINALPIFLTLASRLRRSEVNIMIVNLTMAEFLLCCSFVFGQTFYILWHDDLPPEGCHFLAFFHFTMAFASFIFPPVLAINRYVCLYHNHLYRTHYTRYRVLAMMAGCWAICAVIPFMFMMAGKTAYDEDNHHCCMVVHGDIGWSVAYWLLIIAPLLIFCDGTAIYCNYRIYMKLNLHRTSSQQLSNSVLRNNKEILYFLIADMIFPICFHTSYHIFKFVLVGRTSEFLKRFFISLYLLNSILRGLVTLILLRPYRTATKKLFCRIGDGLTGDYITPPLNRKDLFEIDIGPLGKTTTKADL